MRSDDNRLGWPLTGAALVAMFALLVTSGRNLELLILGILLLASQVTSWRLTIARGTSRALRVFIFTWLVLVIGWPQQDISQWYVKPEYTNLVGCILAAEIVIRTWEQQSADHIRRFRHIILFLSMLVMAMGSNTPESGYVNFFTLLFAILMLVSLWSLGRSSASKQKLHLAPALAGALAVSLGFVSVGVIRTVDRDLQVWAMSYFRQSARQYIGLGTSPTLGAIFNPEPSLARVIIIDGVPGERHLRALTFDTYESNQWSPSIRQRDFEPVSFEALETAAKGDRLNARVVGDTLGMLPLPLNTAAVECDADLDRDLAGSLRFRDETVISPYTMVVSAAQNHQGPLARQMNDVQKHRNLDISPAIDSRVVELAKTVAGEGDPMSRVARLSLHLRSHYQYSLEHMPPAGDALSDFILNKRAAHCQYFASALVMMSRAIGVPARMVIGYYAHELSGSTRMVVRESDAHAWAECWIDGVGWITMDATPSSGLPNALYPAPSKARKFWEAIQDIPANLRAWLANVSREKVFAIILICAGGVLVLAFIQMLRRRRARTNELAYAQPQAELVEIQQRFDRWMKSRGLPCEFNQTWRDHAGKLAQSSICLQFIEAYDESRFGGANGQLVPRLREMLDELEKSPV